MLRARRLCFSTESNDFQPRKVHQAADGWRTTRGVYWLKFGSHASECTHLYQPTSMLYSIFIIVVDLELWVIRRVTNLHKSHSAGDEFLFKTSEVTNIQPDPTVQ
jgi:hypothetical protein